MKSWIVDRWIRVRSSYWFIPSVMSLAAIAMAIAAVRVDALLGDAWLSEFTWIFANQPAGARALLSTVAGSMITVAGVTFSMTLLAVSHASAQIGPRLLAGFMRDRGNQFTLGTFIATFLYCLMVLRTVLAGVDNQSSSAEFVPQIAILIALALAVLSVIVLIYFIHHVPQSISVSTVVARVGNELEDSIRCLYPEMLEGRPAANPASETLPDGFDDNARWLRFEGRAGYLRVLDFQGLMATTREHDLVVELQQDPGDFAVAGQPLMRAWPAERLDETVVEALTGAFSWGVDRTREQDVLFPVAQLLEVLGKAMSPGVNGQYTALLCLDQFERALAELLRRRVPDRYHCDADGNLRIVATPVSHEDFLLAVIRPVRQFVRGDWIATRHLLNSLERLSAMPDLVGARSLLSQASAMITADVNAGPMPEAEKRSL